MLFGGGVYCMLFSLWLCSLFPPLLLGLVAYLAWTLSRGGLQAAHTGSYPTPLRRWGMWRAVAGYFPARLHRTADLPPGKPCERGPGGDGGSMRVRGQRRL